ncbi:MAG: glycosyltransferase [Rhodocyclaceae bacterium]|nr:glycosyltransferase [Rhodocyclaceae bacterium]
MLRLFVGFDPREAVAYHTFCQSIISTASVPVSFTPLALGMLNDYLETHTDRSNDFVYSRFLVPHLCGFSGWAIFADGDMICQRDIAELWALRDESCAVMVAKHDYQTKFGKKYLGNSNESYPRKNWSSVVLFNCSHPDNRILTPDFVAQQSGAFLHRFSWLKDERIGEIPLEWNWLVREYQERTDVALLHYTIGTPCFGEYRDDKASVRWIKSFRAASSGLDEALSPNFPDR